jgi:hypothetical protein
MRLIQINQELIPKRIQRIPSEQECLVNPDKSQLFQGTTIQAFYRRKIKENISIQVGIIGTENLKTFYPTIGIRFW